MNGVGLRALLSMLCVAVAGFFAFHGLRVTGDIEAFVPQADDQASARAAQGLVSSDLLRTVVVTITDTSQASAAELAQQFVHSLDAGGRALFTRVAAGPEAELEKRLYEVYFPRRYAFVARDAAEVAAFDHAWVDARIVSLREQLSGPLSTMLARLAADDPWLAFPALLSNLRSQGGRALDVVDGSFVVAGQPTAVVLLTGRGSPFDADVASQVSTAIDQAKQRVLGKREGAKVDIASVYAFSRAARDEIKGDIERISTVSSLVVLLMFWALFRSLRALLLGAVTLGAGIIAGTLACRLAFGSIHGMTLAFGASLLGVGIDFVAHYVNHCVLEHERPPREIMRALWPGLALGGSTTALGLLAFAWSSFEGMREIAVFSFVSIGASLLATRFWAPLGIGRPRPPSGLHLRLEAALSRWVTASARPRVRWTLLVSALGLCAWGLPRLEVIDDIRVFNHADPAMVRETDRARAAVGLGDAGRFVLVTGPREEAALERNDRVFKALERAREVGAIGAFRSAFYLLRSQQTQRAVQAAFDARADLRASTREALLTHGFVVERFGGATLSEATRPAPLTYEILREKGLADLVAPFRTRLTSADGDCAQGCVAYLSYVQDVRDPGQLQAFLSGIEGAQYFDQLSYLERAYGLLRRRTFQQVCLGLFAVVALCALRYRSWRSGFAVILPALTGSAVAVALLGLWGQPITLFHFAAALLVLSMGEDYAVFLLEARGDARATAIAAVSILLACLTTVTSFGLLALSAHPALSSLGLVTALGVLLSVVLAPLALFVAGRSAG